MGCPHDVDLGDDLTFSITTHHPDTASLADADGLPTYTVFEELGPAALLSGSMVRVDTGSYVQKITCSLANGFAQRKSYTIFVTASVAGVTARLPFNFRVYDPWSEPTRTLTQTAAQLEAILEGTELTVLRGDTLVVNFTGLGSLVGRTKLWFTAKDAKSKPDAAALIQIEESAGLLVIAKTAADTPANGSIVVTDALAGDLTITLDEAESAKLWDCGGRYDVQLLAGGVVHTLTAGVFTVLADVTRAVS